MSLLRLTRGMVALIDDEDFEKYEGYNFHALHCVDRFYAASRRFFKSHGTSLLHRVILGAKKGESVDHINGNSLDNRRSNLRIVTHKQNMQNRKKHNCKNPFKGVYENKSGRFNARIFDNSKLKNLGLFSSAEEAAKAYDSRASILHGEFARLNFPVIPAPIFFNHQPQISENALVSNNPLSSKGRAINKSKLTHLQKEN